MSSTDNSSKTEKSQKQIDELEQANNDFWQSNYNLQKRVAELKQFNKQYKQRANKLDETIDNLITYIYKKW